MLLIGQYDSPFVRRVAVTLKFYGLAYEHSPLSTFGDADEIARLNPLRRVPTLVFDDGVVMVDSSAIIEVLDEMVGPERALLARRGEERRAVLRWCAFAAGAAEKGVSLVYEGAFREGLPMWVERCRAQVIDTLDLLERERAAAKGPWLLGDTMSHADVLLGTVARFIGEALAGQFLMEGWTAIADHAARCEALPEFADTYQRYRLAVAT
ncbi:MAG: glutathione S-transferase family protein [Pseudomonadota bacterium]